jgi:hypothetical protein
VLFRSTKTIWLGLAVVIGILMLTLRSPVPPDPSEGWQNESSVTEHTGMIPELAGKSPGFAPLRSLRLLRANPPASFAFTDEFEKILALADSAEREQALAGLLQRWVTHDAPAAARFSDGLEPADLRQDILFRVMQLWAAQNGRAALSWAAELSDPDERETAMFRVCAQVSGHDPQEAIRLMNDHGLDAVPNGLLENVAARWAARDWAAAYDWVSQQPVGEQQERLMARVVFEYSQTDPAKAADLAVEQIPPGPAQAEAAISVLYQWALRDPAGASQWASRFPEGALRDRAVNEIAGIALQGSAFDPRQ